MSLLQKYNSAPSAELRLPQNECNFQPYYEKILEQIILEIC